MLLEGLYSSMSYYGRSYREMARFEKRITPKEYGMAIQGKRKKKKKRK